MKHRSKVVAALRSGKYPQGRNALRTKDGNGFCCLGVMCDIAPIGEWRTAYGSTEYRVNASDGSHYYLPLAVAYYYGFTERDPEFKVDNYSLKLVLPYYGGVEVGHILALSALNDTAMPFDVIADVIEHHFKDDDA